VTGTPAVTVALCTRDRGAHLAPCLAALAALEPPAGGLEVVVVDNGSTDGTAAVVAAWAGTDRNRRVLHEPVAGLSRARNRALDEGRGDVVLFLDDDAVPPPGWARNLAAAFDAPGPAPVVAAGGPVRLVLPEARPRWAGPAVEGWWSALDLGPASRDLDPPDGPYGTNMAVRRAAALAAGGFPLGFGRRGRRLLSGEETELWRVLRASGGRIRYQADAPLDHVVDAHRLHLPWIARRAVAQGHTSALHALVAHEPVDVRRRLALARSYAAGARGPAREAVHAARRRDPARAVDGLAATASHLAAAAWSLVARPLTPGHVSAQGGAATDH
jgi:glucosyl-dolichyl phosphate glucuronosyltransferase